MYFDDLYLEQPTLALDQAHRELVRIGDMVGDMIRRSLAVAVRGTGKDAEALTRADDDLDTLYEAVILFLGKLSQRDLVGAQPQELARLIGIANYLENIGDVASKGMVGIERKAVVIELAAEAV